MMIEVVRTLEIEAVLQVTVDLQVESMFGGLLCSVPCFTASINFLGGSDLVIRHEAALIVVKEQRAKSVIDDLLLETQTLLKESVAKKTVTEIRIESVVRRTKNIRNRKIFFKWNYFFQ